MLKRDFLRLFPLGFMLGGCANSPLIRTFSAISDLSGQANGHIDPKAVKASPLPSIIVSRRPSGIKALLNLSRIEDDKLYWVSGDRKAIVTQQNRLVRTVGLEVDLTNSVASGATATNRFPSEGISRRTIDLSPGNRFGIAVTAQLTPKQAENISILGEVFPTVLWEEQCNAPQMAWSFTNQFWVGLNGAVLKSQQHIAPDQLPVIIETLKPFSTT